MSKHLKTNQSGQPPAASAPRRRKLRRQFIGLAVVAVAVVGVWRWRTQPAVAPPAAAPAANAQAANTLPPADVAVAKPEFQKLKGKWLRPDGGYVLEIKSVTDAGALDAAYLNPKPIHVAKAEASLAGAAIKVFIELRDVNYPGSTYTLAYEPESDQLKGIYYQALQQQSFEVIFVRMK